MTSKTKLALAAAAMMLVASVATSAQVTTKGGASALLPERKVRVEATPMMVKCAKCNSDWVARDVRAPKGSAVTKVLIEKHRCEGCATTIETRGFGKAKAEVAVHTCTTCGSKACCG